MNPSSPPPRHSGKPASPAHRIKNSASGEPPEDVSGRWLVKAILATLAAAFVALYASICLLFYQGQWQFVFAQRANTPSVPAASIAATTGLPIQEVSFDDTETGIAQLTGWWVPAAVPGNATTVLYFPDGRAPIDRSTGTLAALHALGVNVFAFDYRGTGRSLPGHPSQPKAYDDGLAAMQYLTGTRHLDPRRIVFYGTGVGAAIASHTALQSPAIAGLVLQDPELSLTARVRREQHIHLLPMPLVFSQNLNISRTLPQLTMPKLILSTASSPQAAASAEAVYQHAAAPRQLVTLPAGSSAVSSAAWQQAMRAFLHTF